MYCSKCGSNNDNDNRFCSKCGAELIQSSLPEPSSYEHESPAPVPLIVTSWIVVAISLFNSILGMALGIIVGFAVLLCSILLIVNKNKTAKTNGIIILIFWIITFIIGLVQSQLYY